MKLASLLVAGAALLAPAARADEPVTLKFAWTAPMNTVSSAIAFAWKDEVVKAANGTLAVQVYPDGSIARSVNMLDRVQNGVADFAFGILGPFSRQFPQSFVAQLPFVCENSTECSTAFWRLYANGTIASEFRSVHPLALFCFTAASLHSTKAVRRAEDMAGMKIGSSGKVLSDDVALLGGTPITLTPADFFEAVQRGVTQGVLISWSGSLSFKLNEVSRYHMDTPFGLFPASVLMNTEVYAKLPAAVKRAFDTESGQKFSRNYGVGLDKWNDESVAEYKAMKGHEVVVLAKDELARWQKILEPTTAEWVKATPDGAKVLAAFKAEIAKIRGGS
jgi:TRAP-type C4-dicarboxylate transport system substrate-binding protein